jgi:7,8-dihydro-6-hydroxymethylpterin-pyrophosphokinase
VGGPSGQSAFLNAAVLLETSLAPEALHGRLQQIERQLGRQRRERWGARRLDLDLLLSDERVIRTAELTVPHPRMAFRRFVLEPAAEAAPDMVHPTIGWSVAQLRAHLDRAVPYVAMLGIPGSGKTALARRLAEQCGLCFLPQSAGARPDDSSGQPLARQIQFLDAYAGWLADSRGPRSGKPVISDFCFDQCLAYARTELDAAELSAFEAKWRIVRGSLVQPKLLLVLDRSPALPASAPSSRLAGEIARLAARPGQVVVYVGRHDASQQWAEAAAAIAAMQ